jgi:hypothetical protein
MILMYKLEFVLYWLFIQNVYIEASSSCYYTKQSWCLGVAYSVRWIYVWQQNGCLCLNLSLLCWIQFEDLPSVDCHTYSWYHLTIPILCRRAFQIITYSRGTCSRQKAVNNDVLVVWQLNGIVDAFFCRNIFYFLEDIWSWFFGMEL